MKKLKTQKGITLIALIITIIILLILALVSIRIVLNEGIIQYAQSGTEKYSENEELEKVKLAATEALMSGLGTIKEDGMTTAMNGQFGETDWEYTEKITEYFKVKIKSSGREYIIYINGTIEVSSQGATGEDTGNVETWIDNGDGTFTKGETTVEIGVTTYTNAEVQEKLGATGGTYTGTWTVIGVEGDKLKLVSTANVTSEVILGYDDPGAIAAKSAVDETAPTDAEKLERAIWSYNHSEETLDTAVQTATGIQSAESIKVEDLEKMLGITEEQKRTLSSSYGRTYRFYYEGDAETGEVYSKYLEWNEEDTEAEDTTEEGWSNGLATGRNIFRSYDKLIDGSNENKNNIIKLINNDYSYTPSDNEKSSFKLIINNDFWLASPYFDCSSYYSAFKIFTYSAGSINGTPIFASYEYACGSNEIGSLGVKAVVFI